MTVPLSCQIILSDHGRPMPAIAPESCAYAERLAKAVWRQQLDFGGAFAAMFLHASRRRPICAPQYVARFCEEAIRDGIRAWPDRAARVQDLIFNTVWPLAKARAPGADILAAALADNERHRSPLTEAEVWEECRHVATIATRKVNVRGR